MDFFKGIGDFFGGLFGKKKEEENKPQVQQPQPAKAVEFNKPQTTSVFGSSAVNDINQKQNTLGKSANDVFNGLNKTPKIEAFKPQENQAVQPVKPVPQIKNPYSQEHANLDKGVGQGVFKKEVLDSFNKPTQRPFESAKDFDDRRMNEAIARGDTKQLEEIRNDFQKKSFNTGLFGTSQTDYFDKVNKLNSQITDLALKNNDEALLMRQQGNTRHINNLLANESNHNNTGIVKAVRELPDTLNPMSDKGLFGIKQQQSFDRVSRPVNTELKKYNDWVDQGDSKAGFQWDDLGDYWRFAQKLPSGMVSGTLEAPNKVGGAMTGKYIDKDGKLVDKNALQRAAMLGDAYISTGGLAHGASGTLLKSLGKSTATQTGKEAVKTGAWNTAKDLGKGILTEGVEESTQNLLGEIADRGHFDNGTLGRTLEAGAQGMLGGAMMGGLGKGIEGFRNAYSKNISPKSNSLENAYSNKNLPPKAADLSSLEGGDYNYSGDIRLKQDSPRKNAQFDLLQKTNPMLDDYHTGIRSVNEIRRFDENFGDNESFIYPDFTENDARNINPSGKIRVYSSKDINTGDFVTPSKMMAQDYAGGVEPNSKLVNVNDVAWINGDEGNYLPVDQNIKYKVQAETDQLVGKLDELKSRHQNLTGDEDLVFNIFKNEIQKNALGYFDPKTNKINLNELTVDTLNHEIGHKIFSRVPIEQKADLINEIRNTFGDEALISKYGKEYGNDINLLAEERLADGFNEYYQGKLNGEDSVRLGTRLGIPPKVLAYYDRMIEAIKSVFGATDELKKFYAEIETGKFAENYTQNMPVHNENLVYKIHNTPQGKLVEIEGNPLEGVSYKDIPRKVKQVIAERFQGNSYQIGDTDNYAGVTSRSKRELAYKQQQMNSIDYVNKATMSHNLDELIETMSNVRTVPNLKSNSKPNVEGYIYGDVDVKIGNEIFTARVNIEQNRNGQKIIYDISNIKRGGGESAAKLNSLPRSSNNDSIAQNANEVKYKADDNVDNYIKDQLANQTQQGKANLREKWDNFKAKFTHEMIDDAVAYEKYMNREKGKAGKQDFLRRRAELRDNIDRVRASDMIAKQFMEDNGLTELGKMSKQDMDNFQQYLIAKRHVEDLNTRGIETGRDYSLDRSIVEKYGEKFKDQEKVFRDFNKSLLHYMADNNLISETKANSLIENNPNYAPFQRIMDDAEKFSGNSKQLGNLSQEKVIQGIKGSKRTVANPVESVMQNTLRAVNEAERNNAANNIAKGVFGEYKLKEGQKPRPGYDKISFFEKGQKVEYEVPALVAQEMKNLNNAMGDSAHLVMKALSAPVKALRSGATTANPIFTVSNLVRDQIQTLFTGSVRANFNGYIPAFKAVFGVGKNADTMRAELARNGVIGSTYRQTYGFKHGDLIKELQSEYGKNHPIIKSTNKLRHPIESIADIIGKTEEFTRAQQYFGTKGDSVTKAQAAKNNTLNFSRGGSAVRILNRIIPFLNAGVQGGRSTVDTFKNRPIHSTVATITMGGLLYAAAGQNQANNKELWDRLTESEKKTNLVIFTPGARYDEKTGRVEGIVKIPLPQFLYPLSDAVSNFKGKPEDALKIAGNIFSAITGVDAENPVNQLTPTAIKPFVEAAMNKNSFSGKELVSSYDKNKAPEDKGAKYTTDFARQMARMTGVDAPIIDNFVQNWTGGLGRDLTKSFTDNPDNAKDGGGLGSYLTDGLSRRFLSGSAKSQYQMAEEAAKDIKSQIDNSNLGADEKAKVKDHLDTDFRSIAKEKTKLERGESSDGISRSAEKLKNSDLSAYIEDSLMSKEEKTRAKKKAEKDKLYSSNDAEYNKMLEDYNKNKKDYTQLEDLQARAKLHRAKIGKDFSKDTREAYNVNKSTVEILLSQMTDEQQKAEFKKQLLSYGDKLVEAGLEKKNKFRDKYGNEKFSSESKASSGKGRGETKYKAESVSALTTSSANNNLMSLLNSTRKSQVAAPKIQQLTLKDFSPRITRKSAIKFNKK